MDGIEHGTNGDTFWEVMGLKLEQKKLWDQIETFVKVMGPKVHFSQLRIHLFCIQFIILL